jgi:hypothetical protein
VSDDRAADAVTADGSRLASVGGEKRDQPEIARFLETTGDA